MGSKKRTHGTGSVPISFSTRFHDLLMSQSNRSAYIDAAIESYDALANPRLRGRSKESVRAAERRKAMDLVARTLSPNAMVMITADGWQIVSRYEEGEEE